MLFCLLFRAQVCVSQTNLSWVPLKAALPFVAPFLSSHNHCSCTCLGIAFSPPSPFQTPCLFSEFSCQGSCPTVKRTLLWLQTFGFCPNIQHISLLFVGNGLYLKIFILVTSGSFLFVSRRLLIYQTLFAQEFWKK